METVVLLGAEGVQNAGHQMSSAAHEMQRAASFIQESLTQHERFLENWLMDFRATLEESRTKQEGAV